MKITIDGKDFEANEVKIKVSNAKEYDNILVSLDKPECTDKKVLEVVGNTPFFRIAEDYIDYLADDDSMCEVNSLEDYTLDIFENAMKFLYGDNIMDYINKRVERDENP